VLIVISYFSFYFPVNFLGIAGWQINTGLGPIALAEFFATERAREDIAFRAVLFILRHLLFYAPQRGFFYFSGIPPGISG